MAVASLVSGKIIKIGLSVFERGKYLLQNDITLYIIYNILYSLNQSLEITSEVRIQAEKTDFLKGAWHLRG